MVTESNFRIWPFFCCWVGVTLQAERYDEMVEAMKKVSQTNNAELSVEERNLLSVAYKNVIGARRASWRILASIESKEKTRNNEAHEVTIKEYRKKVPTPLHPPCCDHFKEQRLVF